MLTIQPSIAYANSASSAWSARWKSMRRQPDSADLDFEDRLALMVDREVLERDNKRLKTRLRFAGLRSGRRPGGC